MSDREALIRQHLSDLQPIHLNIIDDSHKHAGHAGAKSGGGHFTVTVVSTTFVDKTSLQRHRLVYDALADLMPNEIHALSIQTHTPEEFNHKANERK